MGLCRAMVITFAGAKLPRIPPTQRCRRCGEEHPPPPQGEAPSCEARCIICDGAHTTGSRNSRAQRQPLQWQIRLIPTPSKKQESQLQHDRWQRRKQHQPGPKAAEDLKLKQQQHLPESGQTAAITSHLSKPLPPAREEIINMDTDVNRGTKKRHSSESIDTAAKELAETSSEDEPVPRSKLPVTSKALERIRGRLDKHDHEINALKVSFNRFAEETIQRFNSIDQRFERIEQQLNSSCKVITPHNTPQHQHGAATSAP
ncbi:hypothetical protein HPB50_027147 [Hyalomma asiaticum]|uniref:Uncharacterized protein n=1 Tax=Hyalomma asiaticum TaxID=266040 RepID=A0ACB7TPT2_HYAAI|nr:hypothetical protein HPB50_027147 [Hyalomma asiaticum]